jgi:hypothetical protein
VTIVKFVALVEPKVAGAQLGSMAISWSGVASAGAIQQVGNLGIATSPPVNIPFAESDVWELTITNGPQASEIENVFIVCHYKVSAVPEVSTHT